MPGSIYGLQQEVYDIVMPRLALHHLMRPKEAMEQMVNAVKTGGTAAIMDVVSFDPASAESYNRLYVSYRK